ITRPRRKDRAQANNVQITLNFQINTEAYVMGHPSELREVLVNMGFNAVDAMPEGSQLTLAAVEVNGAVEIAISDTGPGKNRGIRVAEFQSRIYRRWDARHERLGISARYPRTRCEHTGRGYYRLGRSRRVR